jgi:hypothetical protein
MKIQLTLVLACIFAIAIASCKEEIQPDLPENIEEVRRMLDSIYVEDQIHRVEVAQMKEEYGYTNESKELEPFWEMAKKSDSTNLIVIEYVLENYGWLGKREIGVKANLTIFLVIQHSDKQTQEKYLPMMRKAVEDRNADISNLALMEDLLALRKGDLQIYGSQVAQYPETGELYIQPLINPEDINIRRKSVNLPPIEDYIAVWGMTWDVDEYIKKLPLWISEQKRRNELGY